MHSAPVGKQQLYWRARRGMLELDCLLQSFLRHGYDATDATSRKAFVSLLEYPDAVLLELLLGGSVTADPEIARVVEQIRTAALVA